MSTATDTRTHWQRVASSKVLIGVVLVHLLFGVTAGYIYVARYAGKRKMTFSGGPPTTNPSQRALEHQVAMGKKRNMMSAPAQAKRITTSGLAKVALPDMPAMPALNDVLPARMAGMGGMGLGPGGGGGGGLGSGGGGGNINFFGLRGRFRNVVFLIDISGSMVQGLKKNPTTWSALEDEVDKTLKGLEPIMRFGLVAFASGVEAYKMELTDARNDEKTNAIKWLKKQSPLEYIDPSSSQKAKDKHHGTRADLALQKAFRMKPELIFFVSDGEPTDMPVDDVISMVEQLQAQMTRRVTINVVAYKADSGFKFMKELAEKNGGTFREVN